MILSLPITTQRRFELLDSIVQSVSAEDTKFTNSWHSDIMQVLLNAVVISKWASNVAIQMLYVKRIGYVKWAVEYVAKTSADGKSANQTA